MDGGGEEFFEEFSQLVRFNEVARLSAWIAHLDDEVVISVTPKAGTAPRMKLTDAIRQMWDEGRVVGPRELCKMLHVSVYELFRSPDEGAALPLRRLGLD